MKKVLGIVIFIGVTLLCGEIALRIIFVRMGAPSNWSNTHEFELDSHLIYRGIKNKTYTVTTEEYTENVTTNSNGFRNSEFKPKKKGEYRIVVVGDSFTFGHGISFNAKTFPALLEKELVQKTQNSQVEVINMAVKGYSPDQEFRLITTEVFRLDPDMIVWSLSSPGDMYNLTYSPGWQSPALYGLSKDDLIPYDGRFNWMYGARWIKNHSPSFIHTSYLFNFGVFWVSQVPYVSNKPSKDYDVLIPWATDKLTTQIRTIQKRTLEQNMKLVVAILPYPDIFIQNKMGAIGKTHLHALNMVINALQKERVTIVDLGDIIVKENTLDWRLLYFKKDYHPNDFGAARFASYLADRISVFLPLH